GLGNLVANLARGAGDCLRGLLALLANLILVQEATSRLAGVLTRQNDPNSHCRNAQCRACYQRNELASLHSSTSPVQFDSAHQSRDDVANLRSEDLPSAWHAWNVCALMLYVCSVRAITLWLPSAQLRQYITNQAVAAYSFRRIPSQCRLSIAAESQPGLTLPPGLHEGPRFYE